VKNQENNKKYYIYGYIDPENNNELFYIGKGCRYRYRNISTRMCNRLLYKKLVTLLETYNIDSITKKIAVNLSEDEAYALEIQLIAKIGRRNIGSGTLLNLTPGGDGLVGVANLNSYYKSKPCRLICSDGREWLFESKQDAIRKGFPGHIIEKAIKTGSHTLGNSTYKRIKNSKATIQFKNGDTITYMRL